MNDVKRLIREIHRRSVWQVLTVYLAISWVALQVVETVVDSANLPEWLPGFALVLLVIGFPVVVATAFVQEGAPGTAGGRAGVDDGGAPEHRSPEAPRHVSSRARTIFTWRHALVGAVGALALWGVVAAALVTTGRPIGPRGLGAEERPSLAVLPLQALSLGQGEDDGFAQGFHDEIITRLSKISGLRVTSRTSVMQYAGRPGNLRDIARELDVSLLLEGSLQRTDGQIALNIQLIDGRTDEHVWAESYTRAYTLENVFAMQQELAREIAAQLRTTLTQEETAELAAPPTANPEAWELYQQANKLYWSGPLTDDFQAAVDLYELAVKRDPAFALAHARLSFSLGQLWQSLIAFRTPEAEARMRQALGRALELDPDLPEAFLAQGQIHYAVERDYGRALTALTRAARTGLKADYLHLLGAVQRRLGDFDGALANWEEMVRIDPLSAHYRADLGSTYLYAGRMDDAEPMLRRSIELDPTVAAVYYDLVDVILARDGTMARAREALAEARAGTGETLDQLEAYLDYLDRDWEKPLAAWTNPHLQAWLLRRSGRAAEARAVAEEGERAWREAAAGRTDDPALLLRGAMFAALLGDAPSVAARVDAALALDPVARDALSGPDSYYSGAAALAAAGRTEHALEVLEALSRLQSRYTPALIGLDPQFDDLRGSAGYDHIMENWGRAGGG